MLHERLRAYVYLKCMYVKWARSIYTKELLLKMFRILYQFHMTVLRNGLFATKNLSLASVALHIRARKFFLRVLI